MRFFRIIAVAGVLAGFAAGARAELANGIKAIVNDTVITYQQVEMKAAEATDLLRRQYSGRPEMFEKKMIETLNDALKQLVERQLILTDFKTAGYNLPENYIDDAVQE